MDMFEYVINPKKRRVESIIAAKTNQIKFVRKNPFGW